MGTKLDGSAHRRGPPQRLPALAVANHDVVAQAERLQVVWMPRRVLVRNAMAPMPGMGGAGSCGNGRVYAHGVASAA